MHQCKNLAQTICVFVGHLDDFVGSQMFTCLISLDIIATYSVLEDSVTL